MRLRRIDENVVVPNESCIPTNTSKIKWSQKEKIIPSLPSCSSSLGCFNKKQTATAYQIFYLFLTDSVGLQRWARWAARDLQKFPAKHLAKVRRTYSQTLKYCMILIFLAIYFFVDMNILCLAFSCYFQNSVGNAPFHGTITGSKIKFEVLT